MLNFTWNRLSKVVNEAVSLSAFLNSKGVQGTIFERVAVVGIGNVLNGDDAAGVLAAQKLAKMVQVRGEANPSHSPEWMVVDAGLAPEAFTGPLRRFRPDLVILIDAAESASTPGTVCWLDWQVAEGMSASSHTLPPSMFAQYLVRELGCQVVLAAIQPRQIAFGQGVSREVRGAVRRVVKEISEALF